LMPKRTPTVGLPASTIPKAIPLSCENRTGATRLGRLNKRLNGLAPVSHAAHRGPVAQR
jgi:hypothetical protein